MITTILNLASALLMAVAIVLLLLAWARHERLERCCKFCGGTDNLYRINCQDHACGECLHVSFKITKEF